MIHILRRREPNQPSTESVNPIAEIKDTPEIEEIKELKAFFCIITFIYGAKRATISYETLANSQQQAEEIFDKMIANDFPFSDFSYNKIVVPKTNNKTQCATKRYAIEKIVAQYKENMKAVEEEKQEKEKKEEKKIKVAEVEVEEPVIENNSWFATFNINIAGSKYHKGIKIEKANSEEEARKQLDTYIKKTFSRVRNVTKVKIKKWENEEEFSEFIDDTPVKAILHPTTVEPIKKTLEDLINENFSEEELNEEMYQVVASVKKIRPKDFDDGFFILPVGDKTEDDLFEEYKTQFQGLKRKYFSTRKVKFRQILTTTQFKRMINSPVFLESVKESHNGYKALSNIAEIELGTTKEKMVKELSKIDDIPDRPFFAIRGLYRNHKMI